MLGGVLRWTTPAARAVALVETHAAWHDHLSTSSPAAVYSTPMSLPTRQATRHWHGAWWPSARAWSASPLRSKAREFIFKPERRVAHWGREASYGGYYNWMRRRSSCGAVALPHEHHQAYATSLWVREGPDVSSEHTWGTGCRVPGCMAALSAHSSTAGRAAPGAAATRPQARGYSR